MEDADKAMNDLLFASIPFKANVPLIDKAPDAVMVVKLADAPVRAPDKFKVVKLAEGPVRAPARETALELPV